MAKPVSQTPVQAKASVRKKAAKKRAGKSQDQSHVPVVGIGASAGGLEAFIELLEALPDDTGMAFVILSHLSHAHKSMLSELLARATRMPVKQVGRRTALAANNVYVIPPNRSLSVSDGHLIAAAIPQGRRPSMVIDSFLRSLAEKRKNKAIGVILSGTGTDGTLGLAAIKAEGGVSFAQDERSAKFPDMPRSASAEPGSADFILPPAEIARQLARIARHPYVSQSSQEIEGQPGPQDQLAKLFRLVRAAGGVDFTCYKPATIKRRITRRMLLHQIDSLEAYIARLRQDPKEVEALSKDLLINVTSFFRDPDAFEALSGDVIPKLLEGRDQNDPIRVWVAGCSTGEEAYSIAICLLEATEKRAASAQIQIFATDVDKDAIEKAREGRYRDNIAADVSPERLLAYFTKTPNGYRISKRVRDLCVFAVQNAVRDPPFSRLDLVSCRNVLIYLASNLQERLLTTFHYALKPNGLLLLGNSETVGGVSDLFRQVDKKQRFYAKIPTAARPALEFGSSESALNAAPGPRSAIRRRPIASDIGRQADQLVLSRYAPPGVVVNEVFEIEHFRGSTGPFLEAPSGEASLNVLRMAREGLAGALRTALRECKQHGAPVRKDGVRLRANGDLREVAITVAPLERSQVEGKRYLILFEARFVGELAEGKPEALTARSSKKLSAAAQEINALKEDLDSTRDELHRIVEEQEATNEELQSANEEILSSNEELQSTNEELETAKEELQATNEELTTVNEEQHTRNAELAKANNDLSNLIDSIDIVYLMLDHELRIQRFTPGAQKALNLITGDLGRPITQINLQINVPHLAEQVKKVIKSLTPLEAEVQDSTGRWYSMRVRPYRTDENRIDGAILAFVDIDQAKRSEALLESEQRWRSLVEEAPDFILAASPLGRILFLNRTAVSLAQKAGLGESIYGFLVESDKKALRNCLRRVCSTAKAEELDLAARVGGSRLQLHTRVGPIKAGGHVVALTLKTTERGAKRKKSAPARKR